MAYITLTDLLRRDGERDLANVTSADGESIDTGAVELAITQAQAEVDSYIANQVRLPLLPEEVSQAVRSCTLSVARWYLYADHKTDAVVAEYESARRWLADVAAGRASTGVVQPPLPDAVTTGTGIVAPRARPVFGEEFERRYNVPLGGGNVFRTSDALPRDPISGT